MTEVLINVPDFIDTYVKKLDRIFTWHPAELLTNGIDLGAALDFLMKQKLSDGIGGLSDSDAHEKASATFAQLHDGQWSKRGGGGRAANPLAKECERIAEGRVIASDAFKAWLSQNGHPKKASPEYKAEFARRVAHVAKQESVIEKARKNLAENDDIEVDLDV